jgi:hypothetical protein
VRFIFYGLSWLCITGACVYSGFAAAPGRWQLSGIALVLGLLIGVGGYVFARKSSRKCRACGERTDRPESACPYCGSQLKTNWHSL